MPNPAPADASIPAITAPDPADLRAAGRLTQFLFALGLAAVIGVGVALALPFPGLAGWIPHAFIPTLGALIAHDDLEVLAVHGLYFGYGVLMMGLAAILARRVRQESGRSAGNGAVGDGAVGDGAVGDGRAVGR